MAAWTLADELALRQINVARGALLCAQAVAYPELRPGDWLAKLAALAEEARRFVPPTDPPLHRGLLLAEYLFQHAGFQGDREQYDDPRNSFLNDVLERRLGLPITLSILYVDVARRLEIPAFGVGLPGHFLAGLDDGRQSWFLDPFNGGGRVSHIACARLVESTTGYGGHFREEWLQPAQPRDILARLLANLRAGCVRRSAWAAAVRVIEQLVLVQPQTPEHLRDLGLIHFRLDAPRLAARYLDAYLQRVPEAPDAANLRAGVASALDIWVRQN